MVYLNAKLKYVFTISLLIHDKKYCLQVYYDKLYYLHIFLFYF